MQFEFIETHRADHAQIEAVIGSFRARGARAHRKRIGICNEHGAVYWRITSECDSEFTHVVHALACFGFRNELAESRKAVAGYDALMFKPILQEQPALDSAA